MDTTNRLHATGLLLIRAILGIVFIYHGAQKLFGWFDGFGVAGTAGFFEGIGLPLPTVSALVAGGVEFFGGILLLLGIGTRVSAALLSVTMVVASLTAHSGFNAANGGFEYPLTLAVVSLALALLGPGELTAWTWLRSTLAALRGSPTERTGPAPVGGDRATAGES